jgi:hypothetical protein
MAHLETPPDTASLMSMLKGIVDDAQELFRQQVALVRAEIRSDLQQTKQAALALVAGILPVTLGTVLLCFMFVHLLHWATSPAGADPAGIPLWGCYGIVGGAFVLIGGALIYGGIRKFQSFNPLPDQSAEALQENVQWLTNRK